ncbi:GNAT family N-acetyltransferase [Cohnella fermenti]|uniref:GNAT family N-acetyltransferase n=1 Tax=Cohnella fermenti TaxID=2565925 RepID=A0A4V3WEM6_9BACL|nr:GNAT family protein [Cohnella fermenti]THF76949.1 GNAT family N-acetyltransferase [Cohnella fermenti]
MEQRVYIRFPEESDAAQLADIYVRNRELFGRFSPIAPDERYSEEQQLERIRKGRVDRAEDRRYSFVVCLKEDDQVIGDVSLSAVKRGVLQSCMIGYNLDERHSGKGYMTEAVKLAARYAFEELGLHRIVGEASPRNPGSIRVLEKAGFHREGISRSNLKINGVWEDHQVLALINPSGDV